MTYRLVLLSLIGGALVSACAAQEANGAKAAIREDTIDLTKADPIVGLPFTGIFGSPFTCSSDGDIFVSELIPGKNGDLATDMPDLYRISPLGDGAKHIPRDFLDGYNIVSVPGFFAGRNALVTLVRASKMSDGEATHAPSGDPGYFLIVSDRDGDHKRIIRLDLDFNVVKVAVFSTGELIALGSSSASSEPVVALLQDDGRVIKRLEPFSHIRSGDTSSNQDGANPGNARLALLRSVSSTKFVPWGTDVMMATPGLDGLAIYHFRASGQFERTDVTLPDDEEIDDILGSGGRDNWIIRTRTAATRKTMSDSHIVQNPRESLYEVNPRSGEVLRKLKVSGPVPGEVACAVDGKLAALYVAEAPQPGAPERLFFASATR